ncbi:hypothetical protein CTI12_AA434100 [Artemisia annua]|uniref:Uncharacterized protein n=1 Tax=Artemisia annua TaxID=35608 RepID=A0A2U1KVE1_ARTAN|nr:hypothetical protein CTI12_AA434100 [Artemisia annua]
MDYLGKSIGSFFSSTKQTSISQVRQYEVSKPGSGYPSTYNQPPSITEHVPSSMTSTKGSWDSVKQPPSRTQVKPYMASEKGSGYPFTYNQPPSENDVIITMASTSSTNRNRYRVHAPPTHCKCDFPLALRVFWTDDNLGGRFLCCPRTLGLPYVLPFRADDLDSRRPDDGLQKWTANFGEHLPVLTNGIKMAKTYVVHRGNSKGLMEFAVDNVAEKLLWEHVREYLGVRNEDILFAAINNLDLILGDRLYNLVKMVVILVKAV